MAHGAELEELRLNHDDLGEMIFDIKSGESVTLKSGGIRKDSDANGITTTGKAIFVHKRYRSSLSATLSQRAGDEAEKYLRDLAASTKEASITMGYSDGDVKKMSGSVVDDFEWDESAGTGAVTFEGGGEIEIV